eukprot:g10655.t1
MHMHDQRTRTGEDESQIAQNSDEDGAYDNQQGINSPGVQQKVESAGLLQFQEEVGGDGLQSALFPGGLLTRGAVLDMLAELAAFHHAPHDLMQGVVDILNLVALDGGVPAPVLPNWSSFVKSMERATKKIRKKYFIFPKRCASCHEDISITPEEVPKWILRHLDVKESLDAVLAHPDVQDYLPAGHRADMQTHLYIPDEFKGSPAWNAFVSNPNVLSLALFFDGVPCFRLVNTTYTVHLVTLEILNLPFYLRADPRFTVWSDIIPGPSKPQVLKPWLKPLMLDLEINEWNIVFTSADYIAQVQLMSHKQLGYDGCIKCEMRAVKWVIFMIGGTRKAPTLLQKKTHTKAITYGTKALISAQGHYKGFKDVTLFAHLQEDCIQQSVEDALHLVEGCIKRHLFRLLTGQKIVERPGTGRRWEDWLQSLKDWELPPASLKILDERWLKLCAATGRTTNAAPYKSPGSMTGNFSQFRKTFQTGKTFPNWENLPKLRIFSQTGKVFPKQERYILASQCGEWIFDDLLSGDRKQYVVTLCILFRLLASPVITGRVVGALARLERRFQTLHRKLLPPIAAPLVFHRIGHIIESVQLFGAVFIFWIFRSERIMGQAVHKLPRRIEVEACLEGVIIKGLLARNKLGTITMAKDALLACLAIAPATKADHEDPELSGKASRKKCGPLTGPTTSREEYVSKLAHTLIQRRERLGHRLNLVKHPNGTPLVMQAPRHLTQRELQVQTSTINIFFAVQIPDAVLMHITPSWFELASPAFSVHRSVCFLTTSCVYLHRPILREHETLFMPEDEKAQREIPFTQFVCDGKRFTCDDGRERKSESSTLAQDCSSSFVILKDNTYCLVHSGLQLVVSEGLVPRFLKVTSFTVEQEGVLAERPTLIRIPDQPVKKWVRMDEVLGSAIAFKKPGADHNLRILIPKFAFE